MLEVQGLDGSNLERVYLLERASTGQHITQATQATQAGRHAESNL